MSVYFGPYLACGFGQVERPDPTEYRWACPDPACLEHRSLYSPACRYCRRCGTAMVERSPTEIVESVDHEAVLRSVGHVLIHATTEYEGDVPVRAILVPDEDEVNGRQAPRVFEVAEGQAVAIYQTDKANESGWLLHAFAPEIAKVREAYGADKVSVRWGVVRWEEDDA